jgi:uncharacterized XkdX family phage protein
MYEDVKYYYDQGYYTNDEMKIFVQAAWITPAQYKTITSADYVA